MSDAVISVENLSKRYLIGHQSAERERYVALRDVIGREARNFIRKAGDLLRGRQIVQGDQVEEFWALKNINFEIKQGEVVGIIGRNGAGKSTLLKILSRITEPTSGRARLKGRVASLLEVGTGFHPELTGRENIYLNGAILGMSRAEIRRKFDEIVAFSEIDEFLDTPVKRYSSGMYVRLAFAVAAHLEPEILVVDEVLAVGDTEFQKKCLGKMDSVARGGRTVLFVSHNLPAIVSLCSRAIVLKNGEIVYQGHVEKAIAAYLGDRESVTEVHGRRIDVCARVVETRLNSAAAVSLQFDVVLRGLLRAPQLGIGINDAEGRRIATVFSATSARLPPVDVGKTQTIRIVTEPIRLSPGTLLIKVSLGDQGHDIEIHDDAIRLTVPDYTPFQKPPAYWPRGPVLLTAKVIVDE